MQLDILFQLKDQGVQLNIIQVGTRYDKAELQNIASSPHCRYLNYVPDFTEMSHTEQYLLDQICHSTIVPSSRSHGQHL